MGVAGVTGHHPIKTKEEINMMYFEIYNWDGLWVVWKWTGNGAHGERFKSFKTKKGAENWAKKQWYKVTWRM